MIKRLRSHFIRWNIWRKRCLNHPLYKFLVLIRVMWSPTFETTYTPEEEAEMSAWWDRVLNKEDAK